MQKEALHKKRSFPLRISSVNVADLVTFTEEILKGMIRSILCIDITTHSGRK